MSRNRAILVLVLFLAFALRAAGVGFGLPQMAHQDEPIVVNHALGYSSGDFNPHFFKIPPLLSYLLFGVYAVIYAFLFLFKQLPVNEYALLFFRDPTLFYLSGRLIFGVLLGTASVYFLYRIGKKLFGEACGLVAATFFAVSFLHVRDSHYLYVDIPMLFSILVSLDFLLAGSRRRACVWAGISIAFKYIAAPVVLPVLWVNRRRFFEVLFWVGLVTVLLNPFGVLDWRFFLSEIREQASAEASMPFFHHLSYSLVEGCGFWIVLFGLLGAALIFLKEPSKRWFLVFPAAYYLMISVFSQPYERYAMPILPFLCLFAAYGVRWIAERFPGPMGSRVALLLIAAVGLPTFLKSVYLDRLLFRPDTRTQAKAWILKNIPPGSAVALEHAFFSPALFQTPEQIQAKRARIGSSDPHGAIKQKKIGRVAEAARTGVAYRVYYVEEPGGAENPFIMRSPVIQKSREAFEREGIRIFVRIRESSEWGRRVAVFSPYKNPRKTMPEDEWSHVGPPFKTRELFSRKSPGPYLEIYEKV